MPLAVEFVANKSDRGEVLVADFNASGVDSSINPCAHLQSLARGGGCDQVDDDFMADQWPASPVHADVREQAVLDLVPLARAWRQVEYANGHGQFIGQVL